MGDLFRDDRLIGHLRAYGAGGKARRVESRFCTRKNLLL
jgi:hypothetical protein